jgi:chitinase
MSSRAKTVLLAGLIPCLTATAGCMEQVVARAGADRTVEAGATVTLDGSGSTPKDRGRLNYLWEVAQGPSVTFADARAPITTFTAPREPHETIFRIRLTATYVDLSGRATPSNSDTDEVVIRVRADRSAPEAGSTSDEAANENAAPEEEAGTDGLADEKPTAAIRSTEPT